MDYTRLLIAGVAGALGGLLGAGLGYLVAFLQKKDSKEFFRGSTGQAFMIVPAAVAGVLVSTLGWDVKLKDRLESRTPFEREVANQTQAVLESEPAFRALLRGKSKAEAGAIARELTARGIRRLPVADLRRLGALRLALAEGSPRFCESLWTGTQEGGVMTEAFSRLGEAEAKEFARLVAAAARLEVREEGVAREPATQDQWGALLRALVAVLGPERGAELKRAFSEGERTPPAEGCRTVRLMLSALPELSDDDATRAVLLF